MIEVPAVVRNKARAAGAEDWLERLPALVVSLEADWSIAVGRPYEGGSEAFVAEATRADGTSAVLKVLVPGAGNDPSNEATVLRIADGDGCPELYEYDAARGALLMERLGRPMYELGLPLSRRLEILCATASAHMAADARLRTAHRGREGPVARRLRRDVVGGTRSPMLRKSG